MGVWTWFGRFLKKVSAITRCPLYTMSAIDKFHCLLALFINECLSKLVKEKKYCKIFGLITTLSLFIITIYKEISIISQNQLWNIQEKSKKKSIFRELVHFQTVLNRNLWTTNLLISALSKTVVLLPICEVF